MTTIWMKVTRDRYELPLAVAQSASELACMCHTSAANIFSCVSKFQRGKTKRSQYVKIEVEEDADEPINPIV